MRVSFVRTEGAPDRVYVRRTTGGEVSWSFPTYGARPPHDLVHLVAEAAFGITRGFWGRVDAGIDPARVNAEANRTGGPHKYRGFGDDLDDLYLAEAVANLGWGIPELDDEARLATLTMACAELGRAVPPDAARAIAAVGPVLAALAARWRGLVPKGALELDVDPSAPSRSFAALRALSASSR